RLQNGGGLACEEAVMPFHPTRRRVLGALAAAGFAFDDAFAQPLAPTPQCHDSDEPTVRQTEGPYFKPSSPRRADLVEPNSTARRAARPRDPPGARGPAARGRPPPPRRARRARPPPPRAGGGAAPARPPGLPFRRPFSPGGGAPPPLPPPPPPPLPPPPPPLP